MMGDTQEGWFGEGLLHAKVNATADSDDLDAGVITGTASATEAATMLAGSKGEKKHTKNPKNKTSVLTSF